MMLETTKPDYTATAIDDSHGDMTLADVETVGSNDDSTERESYSPNGFAGGNRRSSSRVRRASVIAEVSERLASFSFASARWGEATVSKNCFEIFDYNTLTSNIWPWIRVCFISLAIGLVEYIPVLSLATIMDWKVQSLEDSYNANGIGAMLGVNLGFGIIQCFLAASLCIWVSRMSAGSGIPGIISYLASGYIPHKQLLSLKTIIVKIPTIVFTIAGGMVVGREGPAIHIGTGTADIIFRWFDKMAPEHLKLVKQTEAGEVYDGESAHEVAILGAACGFAAAFNAPIGGMLYIWEEISMHWTNVRHNTMGARVFLGVCLTTIVLRLMIASVSKSYNIKFNSIVIFDDEVYAEETWDYMDLPVVILLGVVCGIMSGYMGKGAIWVHKMNKQHLTESWQKLSYVLVVVIITVLLFSLVPVGFKNCIAKPKDDYYDDNYRRKLGGGGDRRYLQFNCPYGEYNELASFTLVGNEGMLRHLMARDGNHIKSIDLLVFLILYIPMFLLPFGASVPSGNFVPTLLIGASVGRIFGQLVIHWKDSTKPGVYAVIGAAGMLGGWTRTMMAIVVTMSEITGDVSLTLPMIVVITISRQIAGIIAHHSYAHSLVDSLDNEDFVTDPRLWFNSRNKLRRKSQVEKEMPSGFKNHKSAGIPATTPVDVEDNLISRSKSDNYVASMDSFNMAGSSDGMELIKRVPRKSGGYDNVKTEEEIENRIT